MIKGKAKLEFGEGDIVVAGFSAAGTGGIAFTNDDSHPIGTEHKLNPSGEFLKKADVVMTFTNPDSIELVIKHLKFAKDAMLDRLEEGEYQLVEDEMDTNYFIREVK